jgi:metal-responsive CopG/Arc/MetJ family transcriptional regulator
MTAIKKVGIALPEDVLKEIDELADKNYSNRSHTIVRIWLEWKTLKNKLASNEAEASDASTTPTESKLNLSLAA